MNDFYRIATFLIAPLMPLWLAWRKMRGKEDPARWRERYGFASVKRPAGNVLWLHAASVGEANSVLPLVQKIGERFPAWRLLLTTGTVTSARLMQKRLPKNVIHQYAPIDTPQATRRFIWHWRPDAALFVESEFWPNLLAEARAAQCFMSVINARMSERSFASWQKRPAMIKKILGRFDLVLAQSEGDAERLHALGAKNVTCPGNLKYDAALLPCDESELLKLKNAIGNRPLWLAASTHPGEEQMVAQAHRLLALIRPNLLTVIVPRHPERGADIAGALRRQGNVARRSKQESIAPDTAFYVADTLGELGLFYRLSPLAFLGGSLVKHGGQNPLEAARLACGILAGPHTHNFAAIYREMESAGALGRVSNAADLAAQTGLLLDQPDALHTMREAGRGWVERQGGATQRILDTLAPALNITAKK